MVKRHALMYFTVVIVLLNYTAQNSKPITVSLKIVLHQVSKYLVIYVLANNTVSNDIS